MIQERAFVYGGSLNGHAEIKGSILELMFLITDWSVLAPDNLYPYIHSFSNYNNIKNISQFHKQ